MRVEFGLMILAAMVPALADQGHATEQPRDKGAIILAQNTGQQPPATEQVKFGRFSPFILEQQKGWVISEEPDLGEVLALADDDGVIKAVIGRLEGAVIDDWQTYRETLMNITHDQVTSMSIAGAETIVLRDRGPNETFFYIFPHTDTAVYGIFVLFGREQDELPPEVKQLLATMKIED